MDKRKSEPTPLVKERLPPIHKIVVWRCAVITPYSWFCLNNILIVEAELKGEAMRLYPDAAVEETGWIPIRPINTLANANTRQVFDDPW